MKRTVIIILVLACMAGAAMTRYPVGRPVPAGIYTEAFTGNPCDPNDPTFDMAYKFLQLPTKGWTDMFGANERTLLIHAISDLRVAVAVQNQRISELEARVVEIPVGDPNEVKE